MQNKKKKIRINIANLPPPPFMPEQYFGTVPVSIRVVDKNTGKPKSNEEVYVFEKGSSEPLLSGITSEDGFIVFSLLGDREYEFFVVGSPASRKNIHVRRDKPTGIITVEV